MKLPSTVKDRVFAALSLSLVCASYGMAFAEPVQAESKETKHDKKGPVADKKTKAEDAKAEGDGKQADGTKPKMVKGECPACGRG